MVFSVDFRGDRSELTRSILEAKFCFDPLAIKAFNYFRKKVHRGCMTGF